MAKVLEHLEESRSKGLVDTKISLKQKIFTWQEGYSWRGSFTLYDTTTVIVRKGKWAPNPIAAFLPESKPD